MLDRIVDVTLDGIDAREAGTRVLQARAMRRSDPASRPSEPQKCSETDPEPATPADLVLSYEADFLRRVQRANTVPVTPLDREVGDLEIAADALIAETVRAWVAIDTLHRQRDLARHDEALAREHAELTEQRYVRGLADSGELFRARAALRASESGILELESSHDAAMAWLGMLIGPGRVDELLQVADPLTVDVPLQATPTMLPSYLLIQRPDIRAEWHRLASNLLDIHTAPAFPSVRLSPSHARARDDSNAAELDRWSSRLASLPSTTTPHGAGSESGGGSAREAVRNRAVDFTRTVLTAIDEAETALATLEAARERLRVLRSELMAARDRVETDLERLRRGVGGYLSFLRANREILELEHAAFEATRNFIEARLSVHQALGGSWREEDLTDEERALIQGVRHSATRSQDK